MKFSESRPIGGHVRHIIVKGMADLVFQQNDSPALVIEGIDAKAVRAVKTSCIGDRLIIESDEWKSDCPVIEGTGAIKTFMSDRLASSPSRREKATVDIELPGLSSFTLQGCGVAVLLGLNLPELSIGFEGDGRIDAIGCVGTLEIGLKGAGDVDATALLATHGVLRISGTGDIGAAVQSDVYAEISGIGDIAVYGNPLGCRQERVTGMGCVRYM